MDMSGQIVVRTKSGLTMTLEAAGEDCDGNQLWRQVGSSPRRLYENLGISDPACRAPQKRAIGGM